MEEITSKFLDLEGLKKVWSKNKNITVGSGEVYVGGTKTGTATITHGTTNNAPAKLKIELPKYPVVNYPVTGVTGLGLDLDGKNVKLDITLNKTNSAIELIDKTSEEVIGSIATSDFTKDSFLDFVQYTTVTGAPSKPAYNPELKKDGVVIIPKTKPTTNGKYIYFRWNVVDTDSGTATTYSEVWVNVSDLVDTYTSGNGLTLTSHKFFVNTGTGLSFSGTTEGKKSLVVANYDTIKTGAASGATAMQNITIGTGKEYFNTSELNKGGNQLGFKAEVTEAAVSADVNASQDFTLVSKQSLAKTRAAIETNIDNSKITEAGDKSHPVYISSKGVASKIESLDFFQNSHISGSKLNPGEIVANKLGLRSSQDAIRPGLILDDKTIKFIMGTNTADEVTIDTDKINQVWNLTIDKPITVAGTVTANEAIINGMIYSNGMMIYSNNAGLQITGSGKIGKLTVGSDVSGGNFVSDVDFKAPHFIGVASSAGQVSNSLTVTAKNYNSTGSIVTNSVTYNGSEAKSIEIIPISFQEIEALA